MRHWRIGILVVLLLLAQAGVAPSAWSAAHPTREHAVVAPEFGATRMGPRRVVTYTCQGEHPARPWIMEAAVFGEETPIGNLALWFSQRPRAGTIDTTDRLPGVTSDESRGGIYWDDGTSRDAELWVFGLWGGMHLDESTTLLVWIDTRDMLEAHTDWLNETMGRGGVNWAPATPGCIPEYGRAMHLTIGW